MPKGGRADGRLHQKVAFAPAGLHDQLVNQVQAVHGQRDGPRPGEHISAVERREWVGGAVEASLLALGLI